MSLINDALKRAKQAQKKQPASPGSDAPMQPVEKAPSSGRGSFGILAVALVILALAGWFLWQWWSGRPAQLASATTPATNKPPAAAKSSLASNLTRPFQEVAKLDKAIQEMRQADACDTSAPPVASASSPPRAAAVSNASPAIPSPAPPPSTASSAKAAGVQPEKATNELVALPVSRAVTFPPLKLQGIYFRLSKPSVLINGRPLFLGDEIEGVRIVGIERYSVKIEMKGATQDLFLK